MEGKMQDAAVGKSDRPTGLKNARLRGRIFQATEAPAGHAGRAFSNPAKITQSL